VNLRAMLDTNIVSNALRFPHGRAAELMTLPGKDPVGISAMVAAELRFGASKLGSDKLTRQVEGILQSMPILPFDDRAAAQYADLRTILERQGTPIGPLDTLIAAHALAMNLPLITDNAREFARVPNLRIENWLD
jgi:tRNA(fMet)-specific endonuclease VapC